MSESVVILGASDNPGRFAHKALKMLKSYGHRVMLVNPNIKSIAGEKVFGSLSEITERPDTLTMYVGAKISSEIKEQILILNPKRVIFNPGSENSNLKVELEKKGIRAIEDCTLLMLQGNRY